MKKVKWESNKLFISRPHQMAVLIQPEDLYVKEKEVKYTETTRQSEIRFKKVCNIINENRIYIKDWFKANDKTIINILEKNNFKTPKSKYSFMHDILSKMYTNKLVDKKVISSKSVKILWKLTEESKKQWQEILK